MEKSLQVGKLRMAPLVMGFENGHPGVFPGKMGMTRVLVIDDDPGMREMLKHFLERANYQVLIASDGNEAFQAHHTNPANLIITDILMPQKDGLETIMEFQRHSPDVKIIAMSGGGKIEANKYLEWARVLGAQRLFSKPFEVRELLEAVRELLRKL